MAPTGQPARRHRRAPAPARIPREIERVLIPKHAIAQRVRRLAAQIRTDFSGRAPVVIAILSGTVIFVADLIRHLDLPLELDFLGVSSYRGGTCAGTLAVTKEIRLPLRGRDVLVVDDILDTGQTLAHVRRMLRAQRPRSLRICVLLEKQVARKTRVRADYVGFRIPDAFVVGYGLDHAQRFRNLPYIGILASSGAQAKIAPSPANALTPASPRPKRRRASAPNRASRPSAVP